MKTEPKKNSKKKHSDLFWADQLAKQIITRKKFHYTNQEITQPSVYTVKTSASLSGVLHIGRLSDTIRGDSVVTALNDAGVKTKFIWVAENMDPLRKIPKGVPKEYEKYIGMPVTDVPDPEGSYKSYAEKHTKEYFEVVEHFVSNPLKVYSMREEYKKGTFTPFITTLIEKAEDIRKIQNKYRSLKLEKGWCPWYPICENCGKIVSTEVLDVVDGRVIYKCYDYDFETITAKGCGHKGEDDPSKGNGKLAWKSEWASQWAAWKVVSEGAGKEYQVPNSAWWINGEIVEHLLQYPMPVPIFYEHLMIDGIKMSASLGNVVYPKDWLRVATPELLRLVYNKRLMMTRTFSWRDIPNLYQEFEHLQEVYQGKVPMDNEKELMHCKRLYEISSLGTPHPSLPLSFSHAAIIGQLFPNQQDAIESLKKTGHYQKKYEKDILQRLTTAKTWLELYAPEESKFVVQESVPADISLSDAQREALHDAAHLLETGSNDEKELFGEFYTIIKKHKLKPADFFKAAYNVLLNKDRGPKLAHFILALGKTKVANLFKQV